MSSYAEHDGDQGALVESEGVNAGGPVDGGPSPAAARGSSYRAQDGGGPRAAGRDPNSETRGRGPEPETLGQGQGEMLSRAGSENGLTHSGPGQEMSAQEG